MNRTIKEALRKVVDNTGRNWPEKLPLILAAIHSSDRLRTKIQLYQNLFGQGMKLVIDPEQTVELTGDNLSGTHEHWQWLKQLQEDKSTLQYRVN